MDESCEGCREEGWSELVGVRNSGFALHHEGVNEQPKSGIHTHMPKSGGLVMCNVCDGCMVRYTTTCTMHMTLRGKAPREKGGDIEEKEQAQIPSQNRQLAHRVNSSHTCIQTHTQGNRAHVMSPARRERASTMWRVYTHIGRQAFMGIHTP